MSDKQAELPSLEQQAADWYANLKSDNPDSAGFATWRLADPAHAKAYQGYEQIWRDANLLANDADLMGELSNIPTAGQQTNRSNRYPWSMFSAAAAVLLVSFLALFMLQNQPQLDNFSTPIGARLTVQLADGSEVTLDADSQLQVSMTSQQRAVQLIKGRARFDVAKDSARPFVVSTNQGSVRAVGTIFDVNKSQQAFHVALLEGIVEVAAKHRVEKLMMTAGKQTTVSNTQGIATPIEISLDSQSWTRGLLQFNATPLSVAIEQINRYLKKPLRVKDPRVAELLISGSFSSKEPEKIIKALTLMFGLQAEYSSTEVLLIRGAT